MFTRTVPLALVAIAALAFGLYEAGAPGRDQRAIVRRYADDWAHDDYGAMWATLNASSRRRVSEPEFAAELSGAEQTATASSVSAGPAAFDPRPGGARELRRPHARLRPSA